MQRPLKNRTLEMNAKNTITLPYSEILRIKNACNLEEDPEKEKKLKEVLNYFKFFYFFTLKRKKI